MASDKMVELVKKLVQRTVEGKVPWEQTESDGVFQAAFPGYAVRIFSRLEENRFDYVLCLFNEEGVKIEEVTDVDLRDKIPAAFLIMKEMHDAARRKAMGVEEALDRILAELDKEN